MLFVTHNIPRHEGDVAGSFVLRLAVALQATGVRVHVIAPGAAGLPPEHSIEGVSIERVRYASDARMTLAYTGTMAEAVTGSWSGRFALLQLLAATRRRVRDCLAKARRSGDPFDVVHAHWWFPSALALWKSHGPQGEPLVITMHGSDVRLAERKTFVHPLMRSVLGEASVCTAVSGWLAEIAHRIAPRSDVRIAPMPVDSRHFSGSAHPGPRKGVLFVGRLNRQKGLADLLHALATPHLADTHLTVAGDGPDGDELRMLARTLGLQQRVDWRGTLPPQVLAEHYAQARAVVMPSRGEGLGLVAVEAQLCGTPVVAYADAGLLDVVRPEHGGTLVQVGDIEALASAVARVIAQDETITRLGSQARMAMESRFTPEAAAATYRAIYDAACDRRASAGGSR